MTNIQLLRAPESSLAAPELRRLAVLAAALVPMPCGGCRRPVDLVEAAGGDLDAWQPGAACRCPFCAVELQAVPAAGNAWRWRKRPAGAASKQ